MPKPRSSASKRDREFRKRERDQLKRQKAALKRQRRDNKEEAPNPLTPDLAPGAEAGAHGSDGQDASSLPPKDNQPESDADVGTDPCLG